MNEHRYRTYKYLRRHHGMSARSAAWITSKPRYDVPCGVSGYQYPFQPEAWRMSVISPELAPCSVGTFDPVEVDGNVYLVAYVPDDEPYDWGDMEPTDEDRAATEAYGVCVVRVGDGEHTEVWGYDCDTRMPHVVNDRHLQEAACELIDELRSKPVANPGVLMLPMGVAA